MALIYFKTKPTTTHTESNNTKVAASAIRKIEIRK